MSDEICIWVDCEKLFMYIVNFRIIIEKVYKVKYLEFK